MSLVGALALAAASAVQAPEIVVPFPIDASHSSVGFAVRYLGLSRVRALIRSPSSSPPGLLIHSTWRMYEA